MAPFWRICYCVSAPKLRDEGLWFTAEELQLRVVTCQKSLDAGWRFDDHASTSGLYILSMAKDL
jgi:hypothetical protein